jgi:TP901-1 family phage major tail protein
MSQKKMGRLMLIKSSDGAGGFEVAAALKSKTLSIANNGVDVTTPDMDAPEGVMWSELLTGSTSISVSGSGYAIKSAAEARLVALSMSGEAIDDFEVIVPNIGTFKGPFMVASLDAGGEQEDGVTFGLSLNSAGKIVFTAEV